MNARAADRGRRHPGRGAADHRLVRWLKMHDRPAVRAGVAFESAVGVDDDGVADGLQHRQVAGRVAVGVALGEVEPSHLASSRIASTLPAP